MITQVRTNDDNGNTVLDLSVKKRLPELLSPPASSSSSSSSPASSVISIGKHMFDLNPLQPSSISKVQQTNKRPLRFQCKHCDYKAPSTSLMQNHIYRHTDLTPYACAYCGHKSTTKSTIMVHIELCHPNMEVKILENRVREQDYYRDLNHAGITTASNLIEEPQLKKQRRSIHYDSEIAPINGVAISLKTLHHDDGNDFSPTSDDIYEIDNLEPLLLPTSDSLSDHLFQTSPQESSPALQLKLSPTVPSEESVVKGSDSDDDSTYVLVYNRPKQYYGSLYEPDKQYACRLCSYTTNHRPSMEDHVFVHTDEKPYKCGYCGEEIHTRYAATYHIKYKHTGMPRNFIQNKADISQYYVNRAKKDEEKNQFKVVDTRRVKVPGRHKKSVQQKQLDMPVELKHSTPSPLSSPSPVLSTKSRSSTPSSSNNAQAPATPDYRFLLAWSYYLATQATSLSPMLQQQGIQPPLPLSAESEATAKFLQAMQAAMNPLLASQTLNNNSNELDSATGLALANIKKEVNEF